LKVAAAPTDGTVAKFEGHATARQAVAAFVDRIDHDPVDAGPLVASRTFRTATRRCRPPACRTGSAAVVGAGCL